MTSTAHPTEWFFEPFHVTDGDTVRGFRDRKVEINETQSAHIYDDPALIPRGVPIRLVWVDTPEHDDPVNWALARNDVQAWLHTWGEAELHVDTYGAGGFDRILGDIWVIDPQGIRQSLSVWLMTERGWPAYVKGQ